ncbi:hypothetical protein PIB30_028797 [Stylosanthes scabra]|uniref:Uncharacterized protein n=1 Tax=Stylosanthes scabra TaxID=79078 RepID=A0ABU6RBG2_9FABA|nr:hypothetical protein [Stylosanthes scabra]
MGNGVIYYEYEKRENFEDYDLKADTKLGTFKIRRYHFDGESFVHRLHNVRFDPDCPYEIPIKAPMADQPLSSSKYRRVANKNLRMPKSWELIPPSEGWMCEGDEEEKEIGGMGLSVKKKEANEYEEEEEDPEEVPASYSLPMDMMPLRTTCSSSRIWSVAPSILPSVAVMLQYRIHPRIHQTDSLTVITFRVTISLEFRNPHRRVRVFRVPRLVSILDA